MTDKNIKVLLIEDSEPDAGLIREMLKDAPGAGFVVEVCTTLAKGLARLVKGDIDIVLLDLTLPDSIGLDTFGRIHAHAPLVPVIVVTSSADETQAITAFQKGAQDYLVKGQINTDLLSRSIRYAIERNRNKVELQGMQEKIKEVNRDLLVSNKKLHRFALRDLYTGLYNHKYLAEIIDTEFYRSKKFNAPMALVMLDIDYFKSINDTYGHKFGDVILKQLAYQLKRMVRRHDVVIRYSGEEFIIVSPATDRTQALMLADRILSAVSLYNFGDKKTVIKLKVSLAVVSYPEDTVTRAMDLVKLSEQILARAKDEGGDRIYSSMDNVPGSKVAKQRVKRGDVGVLQKRLEKLRREANENLIESIFAFAKTIEVKDHYTGEHVEKTVKYATGVAKALGLPPTEIEMVRQAAMLHDLGKIGISESILTKKAKLTKSEISEIRKHPGIAVDILRPIHVLNAIIPFILHHHERWDGKGYPTRLKGDNIPLGARIVAIADVYQALISKRSYRKAFSKSKALKIIKEASGTQFDPRIVKAFLETVKKEKRK